MRPKDPVKMERGEVGNGCQRRQRKIAVRVALDVVQNPIQSLNVVGLS
jgi:hypothetical protein